MQVKAVVIGAAVLAGSDPQILPAFREAGVPILTDKEAGCSGPWKAGALREGDAGSRPAPVAGCAGPA